MKEHRFRPFAGDDASSQPADIPDLLLHESVAANVRKYFKGGPSTWGADMDKNYHRFVKKLKDCEKHINKHHNLKKLSMSFPMRVKKMVHKKG